MNWRKVILWILFAAVLVVTIVLKNKGLVGSFDAAGMDVAALFLIAGNSIAGKEKRGARATCAGLFLAAAMLFILGRTGRVRQSDGIFWMGMCGCAAILIGEARRGSGLKFTFGRKG